VPLPLRLGAPSDLFRWPWSVVTWVDGTTADRAPLAAAEAPVLAEALRTLHRPAPSEAPENPFRGGPLLVRREEIEGRLIRLRLDDLRPLWEAALDAGPSDDQVWLHGDLHPRNVVTDRGRLVGLIDWGDLCGGDRATDLAAAWSLFASRGGRDAFLEAYGASVADRARAAGWAVHFASALIDSAEPRHVPIGEAMRRSLHEEAER